ncbi:small ribosomal subunit protein mS29-like [Dysidea avara]|uniref:small ribosomal subunit protein mS29-like n=1 Tax=Dysidea avara TaxID=196820 RepID=UPI003327E0F9
MAARACTRKLYLLSVRSNLNCLGPERTLQEVSRRLFASLAAKWKVGKKDVLKIGRITDKESKEMFPLGLPHSFTKQIEVTKKADWLIRKQTNIICDSLDNASTTGVKPRHLLYGHTGCGMTTVLAQVIQHCFQTGWTIIHIANVFGWTHSQFETRPSPEDRDVIDQPAEATAWLNRLSVVNQHTIKQLKVSKAHFWSNQAQSSAGDNLVKVIELGLVRPRFSTDVIPVVLEEILKAENKLKVLVAIDGFNGLFNPTSIRNSEGNWVEPDQLSLVRIVKQLVTSELPTAVVGALSTRGMKRAPIRINAPPEVLLEEKGVEMMKDYDWMEVLPLSRQEFNQCVDLYVKNGWITKKIDFKIQEQLWYLTCGVPLELSKIMRYI